MTAQYAVGDTLVLTKGDDRLVREVLAPDDRHLYPWVDKWPGLAGGVYVPPNGALGGWTVTEHTPKPDWWEDESPENLLELLTEGRVWMNGEDIRYEAARALAEAIEQRDRARRIAVQLEQENAQLLLDHEAATVEVKRQARRELVNALLDHYPEGVIGFSTVTGAAAWLVANFDITGIGVAPEPQDQEAGRG